MSSGTVDDGVDPVGPGGTDPAATEDFLRLVYGEIKVVARRERRRLSGGETLATTALVHEAYLRLSRAKVFQSRGHFLATAAVAMRRILIDRARAQLAAKRGGGTSTVRLDEIPDFVVEDEATVLGVGEALEGLAALNPRLRQVVECRFFAGYDEAETAEALGVSERTVQRDWATARAWLRRELGETYGP